MKYIIWIIVSAFVFGLGIDFGEWWLGVPGFVSMLCALAAGLNYILER